MKSLYILNILLLSFLFGCVPQKKDNFDAPVINRLVFLNKSDIALKDVRITITKTRELVECGHILPRTECSIGIPPRKFQDNEFDVNWSENNNHIVAKRIKMKMTNNISPDQSVSAVISFTGKGLFSAELIANDDT
jgi:hypothetical protein